MSTKELVLIDKAQQAMLTQSTPDNLVLYRQGPGGKKLAYLPHDRVTRILNEAFHFQWSFKVTPLPEFSTPEEVCVRVRLTVHMPDGTQLVKEAFGGQATKIGKYSLPPGDALKGAQSDALRKAASLLGIGLDLYGADEPPPQAQPGGNGRIRTIDDLLFMISHDFHLSEQAAKEALHKAGYRSFKPSKAIEMYESVERFVQTSEEISF